MEKFLGIIHVDSYTSSRTFIAAICEPEDECYKANSSAIINIPSD